MKRMIYLGMCILMLVTVYAQEIVDLNLTSSTDELDGLEYLWDSIDVLQTPVNGNPMGPVLIVIMAVVSASMLVNKSYSNLLLTFLIFGMTFMFLANLWLGLVLSFVAVAYLLFKFQIPQKALSIITRK